MRMAISVNMGTFTNILHQPFYDLLSAFIKDHGYWMHGCKWTIAYDAWCIQYMMHTMNEAHNEWCIQCMRYMMHDAHSAWYNNII